MKRWIAFILALPGSIFSLVYACGPFYPHGEEVRMCLFQPASFEYQDFFRFNYSAGLFFEDNFTRKPDSAAIETARQLNVALWKKYCNNIPADKDIYKAVYIEQDSLHYAKSRNGFINYLFRQNDKDAVQYLDFAKTCEPFNNFSEGPWERNLSAKQPARANLIAVAEQDAAHVKNQLLKLRYAFLAIRLAHYNGEPETVNRIYQAYFAKRTNRHLLDYWSMYFKALPVRDKGWSNYYNALVFTNAPDKRLVCFQAYDKSVPLEEVLQHAKNNHERAAIIFLSALKKSNKALPEITNLYRLDAGSRNLNFLLLREVNKLEDWLLTPYYTQYAPSAIYSDEAVEKIIENRIAADKVYAKQLLQFVEAINMNTVGNPRFVKAVKAYLYFLVDNYHSAITTADELLQQGKKISGKYREQLLIVKALCINARQSKAQAVIPGAVKPLLMKEWEQQNSKFIFAIARELEFKGNTTAAALLLSKINDVFWRRELRYKAEDAGYFDGYYTNYFFYMDEQFSPEEVKSVIDFVKAGDAHDKFNTWAMSSVKNELSRLYDLLGTKYIRLNRLETALFYLKQVNDTVWTSDLYPYKTYLDANPFYADFYSEHQATTGDTVHFTKLQLLQKLLEYLSKAEDVHNSRRDYYYFLVANCYYNMTTFGNSWLMRRYSWSVSGGSKGTKFPDNAEFYSASAAKNYYLQAKMLSPDEKFSALCLRMAGKCEKLRLWRLDRFNNDKVTTIAYYLMLKKQYPKYYDELMGNCESFQKYLNRRLQPD